MKTLNLTESEVNELRFMLANLNSPSREQAAELVEEWKIKLMLAARKMHPQPVQTVNVN
jgi:hypothetical protein